MFFDFSAFRGRRLCLKLIPIFQKLSKTKFLNDPVLYSLYTLTCWSPNSSTSEFDSVWNRVFKEVIKVKWGYLWASMTVLLIRGNRDTGMGMTKAKTRWGHSKKAPISVSQGEGPQEKPNLLTPWAWACSLQNFEKIRICCLNHFVILWR